MSDPLPDPMRHRGEICVFGGAGGRQGVIVEALWADLTALPDTGFFVERTHQPGVAPGVDGEESGMNGGGDMHRTAVHADNKRGGPDESNQSWNVRAVEKIDRIVREIPSQRATSGDDDADRGHREAKGMDSLTGERLSATAGVRVEENKGIFRGEPRRKRTGGERKFGGFNPGKTEGFETAEVAADCVFAGMNRGHRVVEPGGALPGIGEASDVFGVAEFCHQGTPKETLKVKGQFGTKRAEVPGPGEEAGGSGQALEGFPREGDGGINGRIVS